jgi:putative hydrolase of HD superfamily
MIDTLIEVQRLKSLERTGWMLRGLPPGSESVAAHSFGVAAAAMLLADEARSRGAQIDCELVLRFALLHDWPEVRVGDLPRTASLYFGAEARRKAEGAAFADIMAGVSETVFAKYHGLHEAYERRDCLESRLVKAADIIDLLVQTLAFERAGARGLDEFWENTEGMDFKLEGITAEVVGEALRRLNEKRDAVMRKSVPPAVAGG